MRRLAQRSAARALRTLTRRSQGNVAVVLLYHGVDPVGGDPACDLVPALAQDVFRDQLEHLARHYDVIAAAELPSRLSQPLARRRVPVVLTFDDDLSGHLRFAAAALSECGMPATFYLTGRTLDGPDPFWWQDLQAIADSGAGALRDARARLAQQWSWAAEPGGLHNLATVIEELPPTERDDVARELRDLARDRPRDPGLSSRDVSQLVAAGFEIGFHTRRHDPLVLLSDRRLAQAMLDGRDTLHAACGHPLTSIAYPHGRADLRVARAADDAGYNTGFAWTGDALHAGDPPLLLDRVSAWAPAIEAFAGRLARATALAAGRTLQRSR
jgi:peptidoglycan/xylan/chitin deacetylase (PgdA/CDA1 family)